MLSFIEATSYLGDIVAYAVDGLQPCLPVFAGRHGRAIQQGVPKILGKIAVACVKGLSPELVSFIVAETNLDTTVTTVDVAICA
ncbi:hypothetical protein CY652_19125 [Burkholderia sp. WAC0059]|nr:hypothetical protein CY652_19125 [Burkholderia sp. WAC0059]